MTKIHLLMQSLSILKKLILITLVLNTFPVVAQYNTGSGDLNQTLVTIDADARVDFRVFKADISERYNITETKIGYLSVTIGMSAGDIYMTVELAKVTQKSVDHVMEVYKAHKGKGWGVIARELGIKPGSPEFHALKGKGKTHKNHGGRHKGKKKG